MELDGLSGGLCLLWNKDLELEITEVCKNYNHALCGNRNEGLDWDSTFVYGNPIFEERHFLWEKDKGFACG